MMPLSSMQTIDKWHKTKRGHLVFSLAEFAISYGFLSWAINTGQLWQYALAIASFVGGVRNLIRVFRAVK